MLSLPHTGVIGMGRDANAYHQEWFALNQTNKNLRRNESTEVA